ncbi:MAG: aldo/keto reductase, partial [Acidobacteria bacterium]|nr:aldo/keto reductase [Acidobacteriota bacterium]
MTDTLRRSSRRQFIKETALASSAIALGPYFVFGQAQPATLMKRNMGRLGFEATTLGLGGQASLQWTPSDVDPVKIILKAFDLGVNYFDTANVYDLSQTHYGAAFRELNLVPGQAGYNERLRRSIFLSSKTFLRYGKGGPPGFGGMGAPKGERTFVADEVRRSLSQMFGDGKGSYPQGAYLDQIMIHSVSSMADVDSAFVGYEKTDAKAEDIGVLATLIDFRDGTNLTGL